MKKFISLFLILTLIISAFGCARKSSGDDEAVEEAVQSEHENQTQDTPVQQQEPDKKPQNTEQTKQPETQKDPETDTKKEPEQQQSEPEVQKPSKQPEKEENEKQPEQQQTAPAPVTVPDYKKFSCRESGDIKWKQVRFTNSHNVTLQFEIPNDWQLTKNGSEYTVSRGGTNIGTISTEKTQSPKGFYEYKSDYNENNLILKSYQVNWYHEDKKDTVNRFFEFNTDQPTNNLRLCLNINYTELDDTAAQKLTGTALTVPKAEEVNFPKLSQSNGSRKILLLGNSFINSSRINLFLNDMLKGTDYKLITVARGHAEVHKYAEDTLICDQIKQGEYAYVFMCGYYDAENIDATKTFLDLCAQSDTKYIIFPAHNEGNDTISATIAKYGDIPVLSWKNELDSLISGGMDRYSLCYNDGGYEHSNLYAGYVGAHMIYRNLFEKIPPKLSAAPLSQEQIDEVLKGYSGSMHEPTPPEQIEFNGSEYKI